METVVHPLHHTLAALNRDVDRRLAELSEVLGLRFALRHGDTPTNERTRQARRPPHLLVTTPETFQLMFTGHRLRAMLSSVQAVIVDEVHDLAGSERGWQLRLGLQRLEALCGRTLQKVGLLQPLATLTRLHRGFQTGLVNRFLLLLSGQLF